MWSEIVLPPSLRTPTITTSADIPLDRVSNAQLWCAYYANTIAFEDLHGRPVRREHVFAGTARDAASAQFFCAIEAVERTSGLSGRVMRRLAAPGGTGPHWSDFSPYTRTEVDWIDGLRDGWPEYRVAARGLLSRNTVHVPAESVFPWWRSFFATPLPLPEGEGGGFAAGFANEQSAVLYRGLAEVLERDALMLSWKVRGWPVRPIDTAILSQSLREEFASAGLSVDLYDVGDARLLRVVIALLHRGGTEVTIGACAGRTPELDAEKAVFEALMLRGSAEILVRDPMRSSENTLLDSCDHVVWGWTQGVAVRSWYHQQAAIHTARADRDTPPRERSLAMRCMQVFGAEPLAVDVTDDEFAAYGFTVFRVLQPHSFRKEYSHEKRYRGGRRLAELGVREDDLNPLPHPIG